MPVSDPIEILLTHDKWATRQILNSCAELSTEKFHQRFEMGPGSLHDTLVHMLGAMSRWSDLLAGRPLRPMPPAMPQAAVHTVPELLAMLDQVHGEFEALARAHPLQELVTREREGKTYTFTRGGVITHVTTHGMHHRAQCLNMLRHVGVHPLPMSSVVEWLVKS